MKWHDQLKTSQMSPVLHEDYSYLFFCQEMILIYNSYNLSIVQILVIRIFF